MHPLAISLDTSVHEQIYTRHDGPVKRRTSLDNSCLSAAHATELLMQGRDSEEFESTRPRRFSLNNNATIAVTFLAGLSSNCQKKEGALDLDCHNSDHKSRDEIRGGKQMSFGTAETLSFDDDSSCFSLDDCDSFCDASVQEPANKEYLQKDLGASCFWDIDFSNMGDDEDVDGGIHEMPLVISEDEELDLSDVPVQNEELVLQSPMGRCSPAKKSVMTVN